MPDWHDASCSRPHFASFDGIATCLSCGSFQAEQQSLPEDKDGPYEYSSLKQRSEIRIFCLEPGEFHQPIRGDLIVGDVTRVEYNALSYTWSDETGDREQKCTAYINTAVLQITANCEAALKRLRHRFSKRHVWVDAICINQKNLAERGHQVDLMPRIYSGASNVYIYIGEERDSSTSLLGYLGNGDIPTDVFDLKEAFRQLISRPYFSRTWVLQEVALAKRSWLVCGGVIVPWSLLQDDNAYYRTLLGNTTGHTFTSTIAPSSNGPHVQLPSVLHLKKMDFLGPDQFLSLLDIGMHCEASDPRDKVYALLGLIPETRSSTLVAGYTVTVPDLYKKIGRDIAQNSGPMEAICRVGHGSFHAQLPSWVPDWTASSPAFPGPWAHLKAFAPNCMRLSYYKDGGEFPEVTGFQLGSVMEIIKLSSYSPHPLKILRTMFVDAHDGLQGNEIVYQPAGMFYDSIHKTCSTCGTSHYIVDYGYPGWPGLSPTMTTDNEHLVKYGMIIRYVGTLNSGYMPVKSARYVGLVRYKIPLSCQVRGGQDECPSVEMQNLTKPHYPGQLPDTVWTAQLEKICLV